MLKVLQGLPEHRPDLVIKEVNTDEDHIHILISIPPTVTVGSVVGLIKTNTAKSLNKQFPHLRKVYWGTRSIWSAGYFVSTVGVLPQMNIRKTRTDTTRKLLVFSNK